MTEIETKYQVCNLCDALHRNINDNFESVSFEFHDHGDIMIKIILGKRTKTEDEYIDDVIAEFEALQQTNNVKKVEIVVGTNNLPLKNLVYRKI